MPDKSAWTLEELTADLAESPFIRALALDVLRHDRTAGELVIRAPFLPGHERKAGTRQWHGGPIAALIDTVGDYVAAAELGRALPTIDLRVDYLRPAIDTDLVVTSKLRRLGRTVAVVDIEVANEKGVLVALGRCVYGTAAPAEAK
jgi:uncharacterized protein (TIGR00369 family)